MIGKLIGAVIGKRASQNIEGLDSTGGALLGAVSVPIMRRLGPLGIIAALAGGYALKRHNANRNRPATLGTR